MAVMKEKTFLTWKYKHFTPRNEEGDYIYFRRAST